MNKKIYFENNNKCREAKYLYDRVYTYFIKNKHEICSNKEDASFIIINSCNSSSKIEKKNIEIILKYTLKSIIIIGCSANLGIEKKYKNVFSIPIGKEYLLDGFFYKSVSILKINSIDIEKNNPNKGKYTVQISRGCNYNCSYCFIKNGIGNVKSKPINNIVREVEYLILKGTHHIVFSSDDLGSYGSDIGVSLIDLLYSVSNINGIKNLTFNYIHPKYILDNSEELLKIFKILNCISSIVIPIQSSNFRILKKMNRDYDVNRVLKIIFEIRKIGIKVKNHIITFYPTETYNEFLNDLKVTDFFDNTTFNPYFLKKGFGKYENAFFLDKELNIKKLNLLLLLSKKYPNRFSLENRFSKFL